MFFTLKSLLCALLALMVVAGCEGVSQQPAADTSAGNAEVIDKLTELQKELKALRSEVAQLRQAVTEIHRAAVRPTTAPPPSAAPPVTQRVSIDDDPVLGNTQAKIAIVEFSDYQCPFCYRFYSYR